MAAGDEAIILAGGFGTRLRSILPDVPKCMALVQGKPFITHILAYLQFQGINKVIVSVGYLKDQIINQIGSNFGNIEIIYAIENEPLGTGGAIKNSLRFCNAASVLVLNGDTYFPVNFKNLKEQHIRTNAEISIAVKSLENTSRYGKVLIDNDHRITKFSEKAPDSGIGFINGGIYLLDRKVAELMPSGKFSIENEFFKTATDDHKMYAYVSDSEFLDIGIPEDYQLAQSINLIIQ